MSHVERGFSFKWKVRCPNEGESVQSSVFGFGDYEYRLKLEDENPYHCIYLYLQPSKEIQSLQPLKVVCFAMIREEDAFELKFKTVDPSKSVLIWNSSRCNIEHSRNDFFRENRLLTFVVVFLRDDCSLAKDSFEILASDFNKLLTSGNASDAQLKCGDVTRPAHRLILSARSPVFSAMFRNQMQESATGEVDIGDFDHDLLEIFLEFVYTGKIPETFPDDRYPDLYAMGDKYEMDSLKKLCFDSMMDRLTKDNFIPLLALVERHSDEEFKDRAMESVSDHPDWINCESWFEFAEANSKLTVKLYEKVVRKLKL